MHKTFLFIGALFGVLAVVLGAFAGHGLKKIVQPADLSTFQTGVQYQVYHALALLVTGILYEKFYNKWMRFAGFSFIIGILLFSGSLYLLVLLKANSSVGINGIGLITPFGGIFLILGWVFMLIGIAKRSPS